MDPNGVPYFALQRVVNATCLTICKLDSFDLWLKDVDTYLSMLQSWYFSKSVSEKFIQSRTWAKYNEGRIYRNKYSPLFRLEKKNPQAC